MHSDNMMYSNSPASQVDLNNAAQKIRQLEDQLARQNDPEKRKFYSLPALPSEYLSHSTDDQGVKEVGERLNKALGFVLDRVTEYDTRCEEFREKVEARRKAKAEHQELISQAIETGERVSPLSLEDLAPVHAVLDSLEDELRVGVRKANECASRLTEEYQRLYATEDYRKFAEKEAEKHSQALAKAIELARKALASRSAVLGTLPDAHADVNGVDFVPVPRSNGLGFGGMDPFGNSSKPITADSALEHLEDLSVPGEGIRKWSLSQLDEEEKKSYAKRAAKAKVDREAGVTKQELAERERNSAQVARMQAVFDDGGIPNV
ncbi:hypothetical protein [Streptomyces albidoflavus]|uniref:hypothetical protein n=1 Tax=Streptomyces albidoflavus TaxID=1886 RepID=UPI003408DA04